MKKSFLKKVVSITLCLTAMLVLFVLPGCTREKLAIPQNLDELSLVEMWEKLVEAAKVQNDAVELDSCRLHTDGNRKVDSLSLVFRGVNSKGKTEAYFVNMDAKGELDWYSSEGDFTFSIRNPLNIFIEIDKLGLASLELGEAGLSIQVDFMSGDVGYSHDYSNLYHLEGGQLRPLEEIVFHSRYPWCAISVFKLLPYETVIGEDGQTTVQATTAADRVPPEERTSQIWFLSEDINKAEIVEYLDDKQGYDDFTSGIHNVLPEGWEMEAIAQEGLMGHPHGLDEPLFRIDFVDPTHQFEYIPDRSLHSSLRLYFYDIKEKDVVLAAIEAEKLYSWDIPDYFAETAEYIIVTSPLYINGGCFTNEAMSLYEPLEKALKDYFSIR